MNPYTDIENAAAALLAGCPSVRSAAAVAIWNGEDAEELYAHARKHGVAVWVHLPSGSGDPQSPRFAGSSDETLEVLAVKASMQGRTLAADEGKQLAWEIVKAVKAAEPFIPAQRLKWLFRNRDTLSTSPTAVAIRIRFSAPVHLDEYTS